MISVIVPIFNAEEYLDECIESIINQSYKDLELLLIDDGSTDKSSSICDNYAQSDKRIRVFHKINEGVSVARNIGIEKSQGEWLMFVDADDYLLPNAIAKLQEISLRDNSDIVFGNAYKLSNKGEKVIFDLHILCSSNVVNNLPSLSLWGYLIKRSPIDKNHLRFVEGLAYSEDGVFLDELALSCNKISIIKDFVYMHRDNPSSVCKSKQFERKIRHQFWAAQSIGVIVSKYGMIYAEKMSAIHNDELSKIKAGINVAISSDLQNKHKVAKRIFSEFYPSKYHLYFNCCYLKLYIVYHFKQNLKKLIGR